MVLVSYSGREINAKLVYYGPGLSGKTTNLEYIYGSIPPGQRGKMVSMKTKTERTLFFDFLPVNLGELSGFKTRFLLYTVPGQVYYNATRKLVLKGVDAVVFVADSKRGKMDENVESLENLRENLREHGLTVEQIPFVLQYNKRDLPDVYTTAELEEVLNPDHVLAYEAVATTGQGVVDTFKGVSRLLLKKLAADVGVPVVTPPKEAAAHAAGASAPASAAPSLTQRPSEAPPAFAAPPTVSPPEPEVAPSPTPSRLFVYPPAAHAPSPGPSEVSSPPPVLQPETLIVESLRMPSMTTDRARSGLERTAHTGEEQEAAVPISMIHPEPVERGLDEPEFREGQGRGLSVGARLRRWLSRPSDSEPIEEDRFDLAAKMETRSVPVVSQTPSAAEPSPGSLAEPLPAAMDEPLAAAADALSTANTSEQYHDWPGPVSAPAAEIAPPPPSPLPLSPSLSTSSLSEQPDVLPEWERAAPAADSAPRATSSDRDSAPSPASSPIWDTAPEPVEPTILEPAARETTVEQERETILPAVVSPQPEFATTPSVTLVTPEATPEVVPAATPEPILATPTSLPLPITPAPPQQVEHRLASRSIEFRGKVRSSRKAREVIVPLVLEPEDFERGIVLRLAIQASWLQHDDQDEDEGEIADAA